MGPQTRDDVRNLAIIAHVDHGKTTLVDALLWQSEQLRGSEGQPPAADPDRQKSITVMPKQISFVYAGTRINIIDTPGQADPGEEVERMLKMVDGVLFVVDSCEGPVPRTRFALRRALEAGLAPLVVLNKMDLPRSRPAETLEEIRETFRDLEATPDQLSFPVFYANAWRGLCRRKPDGGDESMEPLLREILRSIPPPRHDSSAPLQMLVTGIDYDDFLGRLALGKIVNGRLQKGQAVARCRLDGERVPASVGGVFGWEGLRRVELERAGAGDIVEVAGVGALGVGETLADSERPRPLPPVPLGEPVISVRLAVNDSPMSGAEGEHVAPDMLRERLWKELLTNVSIRVEETESPDAFRLSGRGELPLVILIEMMRREGFEMSVGKPEVLTRRTGDGIEEPMELLVLDCPEAFTGVVGHKIEDRGGKLSRMVNHGTGRVRMEYRVPSRGLLGFRAELLSDTKGTGIMNHKFDGYDACEGSVPDRPTGSLVADSPGRCTAYAINHLQHRGTLFVAPGDPVYEGMIIGENSRPNDVDVNVTKTEPKATGGGAAGAARLIPPRSMSLEQALDFVREDELVEVTPRALRLRKRVLAASGRPHPD